jgi:hypothetical protein
VSVGRAGAGDRLDDEREAEPLGGGTDGGLAARRGVPRRANAGGVQRPLHALLVAKRDRALHRKPGGAQRLAQAGREHHARLPETLDAVGLPPVEPSTDLVDHRLLVPQRAHPQIVGEANAHRYRQQGRRLIAEPETSAPISARPRTKCGISAG